MATYLYGLILTGNAARVPRASVGIGGVPVRVLRCDGLAALVSTLDVVPAHPTLDDLRAHDAAMQAAVDAGVTVVAARFRQAFGTDEDACRHIAEQTRRIAALLSDFDGCVEMRLLLSNKDLAAASIPAVRKPDGALDPVGPGHAYLETLRARTDPSPELAFSLKSAFGDVVHAERVSRLRNDAAAFAHLVHRDSVPAYREIVASFPAFADARIVGPLALYSFAEPAQ